VYPCVWGKGSKETDATHPLKNEKQRNQGEHSYRGIRGQEMENSQRPLSSGRRGEKECKKTSAIVTNGSQSQGGFCSRSEKGETGIEKRFAGQERGEGKLPGVAGHQNQMELGINLKKRISSSQSKETNHRSEQNPESGVVPAGTSKILANREPVKNKPKRSTVFGREKKNLEVQICG